MEDVRIPFPNPFLTRWLVSDECKRLVESTTHTAQMLYQAVVAKESGDLARTARVSMFIGGRNSDRWVGQLTVGGRGVDYGASHEFGTDDGDMNIQPGAHDLNVVLNQLGGFV